MSDNSTILCVELSLGLLDAACTLEQFEQHLIPYVLEHTQSPEGMAILGFGKKERQKRVRELTQTLVRGEGDEAMRFQNHLRSLYGTRMQWIESSLELMTDALKRTSVSIVGFKGEDSGVHNVELLCRCQRLPVDSRSFDAGSFGADDAMDFLLDLEKPRPLWAQLAQLIPSMKNPTVVVFGTSPTSTETVPDRISVVASVLESLGNPCLSVLSFGPWSSERLSGLEELCAWSGGLSINLQDPEALPLAVQSVTKTLLGPDRGSFLAERRSFYRQKEDVGCTRWHLSCADVSQDPHQTDFVTPSSSMLAVLQDTEFTPKRRWARSLRWWRRRRCIRDCVFADGGSLGVELDNPSAEGESAWVVAATHPPASALDLKNGSRLEAVNCSRVNWKTPRVEIAQRCKIRPVSLTFREFHTGTSSSSSSSSAPAEDIMVEVIISEMRERAATLKPGEPPLSVALEANSATERWRGKVSRLCERERRRREEEKVSPVSSSSSSSSSALDTHHLFAILCAAGSLELLGRCCMTCRQWRTALRLPLDGEPKTPAQSLWSFLIRYGDTVRRREEFWLFLRRSRDETGSDGRESVGTAGTPRLSHWMPLGSSLDAQVMELGAGKLLGLSVAHRALERLESVLGFSPKPAFEHVRATVLWGLGSQAFMDLCSIARLFQILLAACYMPLFRHLGSDGMAPEMFFTKWTLTLLTDVLAPQVLIRLWEIFFVEKSFKCVLQACVYIFGASERELKKCFDMEQCMELMYNLKFHETDPVEFWRKAGNVRATRSLLRRMRET